MFSQTPPKLVTPTKLAPKLRVYSMHMPLTEKKTQISQRTFRNPYPNVHG